MAMPRELKFIRAFVTLAAAAIIAGSTHMAFFAMIGRGGFAAALTWPAIRDMLLVGLLPPLAVSVWVLFSPDPTFRKALLVAGATAAFEVVAFLPWLFSIDDPLSQSYASLRLLPILGGVGCGLISFAIGAQKS